MLEKLTLNEHNNWVDSNGRVARNLQIIGRPTSVEEIVPPDLYKGQEATLQAELKSSSHVTAGRNTKPNAYLLLEDYVEEQGVKGWDGNIGDQWERDDCVKYSFAFLLANKH